MCFVVQFTVGILDSKSNYFQRIIINMLSHLRLKTVKEHQWYLLWRIMWVFHLKQWKNK